MHAAVLSFPALAALIGVDCGACPAGAAAGGASVFDQVFPLTMLVLVGLAIPLALLILNRLASRWANRTANTNPAKLTPYESGLPSVVGDAGGRFSVKFYLIAMLFLAFDVEVAFLYAWAWKYLSTPGWGMLGILLVFLVLLEVGYLYLYRKGALDWDR